MKPTFRRVILLLLLFGVCNAHEWYYVFNPTDTAQGVEWCKMHTTSNVYCNVDAFGSTERIRKDKAKEIVEIINGLSLEKLQRLLQYLRKLEAE